jgi:hypothetical protein
MRRAGAVTGEIIIQNPDIPTFIREGSKEIRREWLKQAYGDEGSPSPKLETITLSRSVDATGRLSEEQRNRLDKVSEGWQTRTLPGGGKEKHCMLKEIHEKDIKEALNHVKPQLLESESRMLEEDFGIKTKVYAQEVYTRENGYGVKWIMLTHSRDDTKTFYNEIGFPQQRKQEKLESIFKDEGG